MNVYTISLENRTYPGTNLSSPMVLAATFPAALKKGQRLIRESKKREESGFDGRIEITAIELGGTIDA